MVRLTRYSYSEEREMPIRSSSSTRVSPFFGPYDNCNSIDELCDRFTRYHRHVRDMVNMFQVDAETQEIINQTPTTRPPLAFHNIRGSNVVLQRNGRIARRRESFCKGLAFSNRPVEVNENVCIKLSEVATNWSGVLRFGVTNFDPDTYRNIPVPKFACPDLTTKDGYWAKALPERYSIEGNILHFYVSRSGELYYGINGSQKGLFLSNINTNLPMWLIVDIYGNSVALEFLEPSEFRPRRSATMSSSRAPLPLTPRAISSAQDDTVHSSINTRNEVARSILRDHELQSLRFHRVTGRHITLNNMKETATRTLSEYAQGYVFTERPIRNNEKVCIQITGVESMYEGGIAFGFTCCDPSDLRSTELPEDSSDLVEMPDYWVGIKDVALRPKVNSLLRFWVTDGGEVFFEMDKRPPNSILFVDNSIDLYMYFDVYGSTTSIKLLGSYDANEQSPLVVAPTTSASSSSDSHRNATPLSIPVRPAREPPVDPSDNYTNGLRVNLESLGLHHLFRDEPERPRTVDLLGPDSLVQSSEPSSSSSAAALALFTSPPPRTAPVTTRRIKLPPKIGEVQRGSPPAIPARPAPILPNETDPRIVPSSTSSSRGFSFDPPQRQNPFLVGRSEIRRSEEPSFLSSTAPSFPPPRPPVPARDTTPDNKDETETEGECLLCMEAKINAVLYTCGHMCMCFTCAKRLTQTMNPCCPICRATIVDVIRCFKS